MRRSLIGLVATAIVAGCTVFPSTDNYETLLKGWVGRSEDELIKDWGAPSSVFQATGSKYYMYVRNKTCGDGKGAYTCVCNTTFELESSRVRSWRWDGNGCSVMPPDVESSPFSTGRG
jgi:hypothetical protein